MAAAIIRGAGLERYYAEREACAPRPEPIAAGWGAVPIEAAGRRDRQRPAGDRQSPLRLLRLGDRGGPAADPRCPRRHGELRHRSRHPALGPGPHQPPRPRQPDRPAGLPPPPTRHGGAARSRPRGAARHLGLRRDEHHAPRRLGVHRVVGDDGTPLGDAVPLEHAGAGDPGSTLVRQAVLHRRLVGAAPRPAAHGPADRAGGGAALPPRLRGDAAGTGRLPRLAGDAGDPAPRRPDARGPGKTARRRGRHGAGLDAAGDGAERNGEWHRDRTGDGTGRRRPDRSSAAARRYRQTERSSRASDRSEWRW